MENPIILLVTRPTMANHLVGHKTNKRGLLYKIKRYYKSGAFAFFTFCLYGSFVV